jgi:membrane-associated phospholipid phosphatase
MVWIGFTLLLLPKKRDRTTAMMIAAAIMIFLCLRKHVFSVVVACLALLISFPRLYLAVHYPGDVLAGAFIGTACSMIVFFGYRWIDGIQTLH